MKESKWILLRFAFALSIGMIFIYELEGGVWAQTQDSKQVKGLAGEQLYEINCSRCHTERYPTERTEAQWKTIMMHMRVRANLPADQAKKILKYLKDNN